MPQRILPQPSTSLDWACPDKMTANSPARQIRSALIEQERTDSAEPVQASGLGSVSMEQFVPDQILDIGLEFGPEIALGESQQIQRREVQRSRTSRDLPA